MDASLVLRKMNLHERFGLPAMPLSMHSKLHQHRDLARHVIWTATVQWCWAYTCNFGEAPVGSPATAVVTLCYSC